MHIKIMLCLFIGIVQVRWCGNCSLYVKAHLLRTFLRVFVMGYALFCFFFFPVSTETQEGLKNKTQGSQKELNPLTDIPHTAGSKKPVTVGREETMIDILVAKMDEKNLTASVQN